MGNFLNENKKDIFKIIENSYDDLNDDIDYLQDIFSNEKLKNDIIKQTAFGYISIITSADRPM